MDDRDDWGSILAGALVRFKNLMEQYNHGNIIWQLTGGEFRPFKSGSFYAGNAIVTRYGLS